MVFEKVMTGKLGKVTFKKGKYLSSRSVENYRIKLYVIESDHDLPEDEFYEIFYNINENMLPRIEKMTNLDKINLYL
ncbi:MAG: hypothetical protein ACOCUL_02690 [Bacteroidota bacterium]